jgi:glycosyltransferase involved in cell wall biosynthesis
MGTSNWQQIPFCIEAMMRIAPERVLDIGVGFGRWGMITREFCDVWFGRVLPPDWKVHVEGVEAFPKNINAYHSHFYDKVHIGDLRDLLPTFKDRWNLIIFGDVLEHFEKHEAIQLLHWAVGLSDYVLVNIPLGDNWQQDEAYDNPYERHLSQWTAEEFEPFFLRRREFFRDYIDRPSGTFILSQTDPRGLTHQLFSRATVHLDRIAAIRDFCTSDEIEGEDPSHVSARAFIAELQQAKQELETVKNTIGYRAVTRLRYWRGFPLLHKIVRTLLAWRVSPQHKTPASRPKSWAGRIALKVAPQNWEFVQNDPQNSVVAICHPQWQGARSAALGHSPNLLLTPETDFPEIKAIVDCLEASGATHFIADGFYRGYAELLRLIRKQIPYAGIFYVHHGSFFQMLEDHSLPTLLAKVSRLQQEGVIDRVGFCKAGMAEVFERLGVPAFEVLNRVPHENVSPQSKWKTPASVFIPVGAQLRKNPHTQLLGALLCPDVDKIHLTCDLDLRYLPRSALKRVALKVHRNLDREATRRLMRQSNVVLYATISECAPMVPLESLALGVPCLTGDNHGLFDDYPALAQQLLISRADDPWAIAEAISNLKQNYRACCAEIQAFNEHYDRCAEQSLNNFLRLGSRQCEEVRHVRRAAG